MAILKCKMCGGEMELQEGAMVAECPYCLTKQTFTKLDTAPLIKRIDLFLRDGEWDKADEYIERVLDIDPVNAEAYYFRFLQRNKCADEKTAEKTAKDISNDKDFEKAASFANEFTKVKLDEIKQSIEQNYGLVKQKLYRTVGSYVKFGNYPQTANELDRTPIEWLVLDYDEEHNKSLLLSRYGLDAKPYDDSFGASVTWETCGLRSWLNSVFCDNAFSNEEQSAIITNELDNSIDKRSTEGYPSWSSVGGNNTLDKVFILSYTEANKFFGAEYGTKNNKAMIAPTEYAIKAGAHIDNKTKNAEGNMTGYWWLRSPGFDQRLVYFVYCDGSLLVDELINRDICVRPAIWLDLESEIL